jgi:carboxylesterase type B
VNTAFCQKDAGVRCNGFGEALWSLDKQTFNLGLNNSLSYQVYQGNYPENQPFWVASGKGQECRSIDVRGKTQLTPCSSKLPALCTQSAPVSNATFADTSAQFQVAQKVGKQTLTGYRDFYNWRFFGVRFAPQPERFGYSTVYDGEGSAESLNYGIECVQNGGGGSEDCLFLNVWTPYLPSQPSPPAKKLKAVMFYVFGDGFVGGSANVDDLGNMASRGDVVVVAINYRLANLGFLALDDGVTNGNYGIQDAITGLEWVKKNIKAFGGNPSRITIYGSSAGASLVRAMLASPKAEGLFSAAIMESNPAGALSNGPYSELQTIEQVSSTIGAAVLNATGCSEVTDHLACLRAYDPIELNNLAAIAKYVQYRSFAPLLQS